MTIKTVRNIRRLSQSVFFFIFFWLILNTNFQIDFSGPGDITLPYPVSLFLQFDPLTALATTLATGTLHNGLLWSLVILLPTIFLGRFFCGWICPLGTLNQMVSEIPSQRLGRKGKGKIESNKYKKYQRIKYYLLLFFLAAAFIGTLQIGLLDPLALLARSLGTVILPTIHTGLLETVSWIKGWGWVPLGNAVQAVYNFVAWLFLPFRQMHFHTIFSLGLFFLVIMALNRLFTRFWCRGICPLGALLGIFSRYALFGLTKDETICNDCRLCLEHCQGADNPHVGARWRQSECHLCLNCQATCPQGSLAFTFFPHRTATKTNPPPMQKIDITRRKVLASLAGGVALYPLLRSGDAFESNFNPHLIRPPGSVEEKTFLCRCIRCGQCMRVCPNNALHPTLLDSGIEGIWTPFLIARIGYCEPTCTLCGEVCPTGAILRITSADKVGDQTSPPIRIGTAFINRGRCLPWAMEKTCQVCEEWCPTSPKAIYLKEEDTIDRRGNPIFMRRPYVDPDLCTGCGACEYACPVVDEPAIYITNVGETRSAHNQILLQRHSIAR